MAEGTNVRFTSDLQRFIKDRTGENGLYSSASEYIRDLVRHDFEREEEKRWEFLRSELKARIEADEGEFIPLDAAKIIARAKARRKQDGRP